LPTRQPLSMHAQPRLICLMGAECTGKTTLAQTLAQHFGGVWVAEHLRSFCQQLGRTPQTHEQRQICLAQLRAQRQARAAARQQGIRWVFCDTSALQTAVYSAHYFADSGLLAAARALHARYALTLLLTPDLPWLADGVQRDGVAVQQAVHARLRCALQSLPCVVVSGQDASRVQAAIDAVNSLNTVEDQADYLHKA